MFLQVITYKLRPSSSMADFTGFFPSEISDVQKNLQPNFVSNPYLLGINSHLFEIQSSYILNRFFFFAPNPGGKTLNTNFSPYIFRRPTVLYVITDNQKSNNPRSVFHTPLVCDVLFFTFSRHLFCHDSFRDACKIRIAHILSL